MQVQGEYLHVLGGSMLAQRQTCKSRETCRSKGKAHMSKKEAGRPNNMPFIPKSAMDTTAIVYMLYVQSAFT